MTIKVTLSMAGIDESLELRVTMAAQLLGASRITAQIAPWDGMRRDILVADVSDAYGRAAYGVARRRGDAVLALSRSGSPLEDGTPTLATSAQVVELQQRLRELALLVRPGAAAAAPPEATVDGLLGLCVGTGANGTDFVARSGSHSVVVRRAASRIVARSHSDLAAAKATFLGFPWTARAVIREDLAPVDDLVSHSLDAFLIGACEAHERKLPSLGPSRHRLAHWPDLGTLADNTDAMRLSGYLMRNAASVDELVARCQVDRIRANAFCWAMRAGGLLTSEGSPLIPARQETSDDAPRSIIARLARRFGLMFGTQAEHV